MNNHQPCAVWINKKHRDIQLRRLRNERTPTCLACVIRDPLFHVASRCDIKRKEPSSLHVSGLLIYDAARPPSSPRPSSSRDDHGRLTEDALDLYVCGRKKRNTRKKENATRFLCVEIHELGMNIIFFSFEKGTGETFHQRSARFSHRLVNIFCLLIFCFTAFFCHFVLCTR